MYSEILVYFLRLGCLGFGGPIALVAQMQTDLVEDRKWISHSEFAQALALIKSMPGPLAFSTATYLGYKRGGFWGGSIAGWILVLPAFLIMILLAAFYDSYSQIDLIHRALLGMQAGALALILFSIKGLGQSSFSKALFWIILILSLACNFMNFPEPLIILGAGLICIASAKWSKPKAQCLSLAFGAILLDERLLKLFWICFKTGAFVFGTGLAMVPLMEQGFVQETGWLAHSQFLDALSFGQMTPGPVLITVSFVGYKVAGFFGAVLATFGIFLASFVHMTTWFPRVISYLSRQKWIADFTLGALAAVIATLLWTSQRLLQGNSLGQNIIVAIFVVLLFRIKIPSWALILGGGLIGTLIF